MLDGGLARLKRLARDGQLAEIALPFDGTLSALHTSVHAGRRRCSRFTGWLTPADIWSVDARRTRRRHRAHAQARRSTSAPTRRKRLFATARDGTARALHDPLPQGPASSTAAPRPSSPPTAPTAASAYTPAFAGRAFALMDAGCIVGYANVRGGGEYGRDWHKAGQLANKPNTWRDLIDVCLDLCQRKYTAPGAPGDRRPLGGRHHRGARAHRAPGAVRRGGRRRRLVQPAALRGRAERLRRGARVGRDPRGVRLPRAEVDRQLPGGQARHGLPGGAADHRGHRPARRRPFTWRR